MLKLPEQGRKPLYHAKLNSCFRTRYCVVEKLVFGQQQKLDLIIESQQALLQWPAQAVFLQYAHVSIIELHTDASVEVGTK